MKSEYNKALSLIKSPTPLYKSLPNFKVDIHKLRIGNYYRRHDGLYSQVTRDDFVRGGVMGNRIPIDRETIVLLHLGKKSSGNGIFITWSKKYNSYALCAKNLNNIICFPEYVDQVQNIYQATTGKELSFLPYIKRKRKAKKYPKVEFFIKEAKSEAVSIAKEEIESGIPYVKPKKQLSWWQQILKFGRNK